MDISRRDFIISAALGLLQVGTGCIPKGEIRKHYLESLKDGEYDNNDLLVGSEVYDMLLDDVVGFDVSYVLRRQDNSSEFEHKGKGAGSRYKSGLVTVNHIIKPPVYLDKIKGFVTVDVLESKVFLNDQKGTELDVKYGEDVNDIAFLDLPGSSAQPIEVGDSRKIKKRNHVALVGRPGDLIKLCRSGEISSEIGPDWQAYNSKIDGENLILTWNMSTYGDSGGALYAFLDGEPRKIGMLFGVFGPINYYLKYDYIERKLKEANIV
jgi:S1-C subfamily serine protease